MENTTTNLLCPDCGNPFNITAESQVGDILECQECGTEVELTSLNPPICTELFEEK